MQPVSYKWIPVIDYSSQQQEIVQGQPFFLEVNNSLTTVRQVNIGVQDLATAPIPFLVSGTDFMGGQISETATIPNGQDNVTTVNFYRTIQSIIPQVSDSGNLTTLISSLRIGYTQPYITDVFNKNALYSYEVNVTTSNADFEITPQYTLSSFSQYNDLNHPELNTTVNNIVWLPLPAATNPPIPGDPAEPYGYSFSDFPITALRLAVETLDETISDFAFEAKILQQGVWM